jgi:Tfp pilus assembly protein FimT
MTIAVLGILAAILIPQLGGDLPERLNSGAQVVSADLDYARSLAVANNTNYRITFDTAGNRYVLSHSGANPQFNTLPSSPFRQNDDPVDQQTTKLGMLPIPEPGVKLVTVVTLSGSPQTTTSIEFTPLGGTTSSNPTAVWLASGNGTLRRYISIGVDPITGLVTIGRPVAAMPPAVTTAETTAVKTGL